MTLLEPTGDAQPARPRLGVNTDRLLALCAEVDAEAAATHGPGREGRLGTSLIRDALAATLTRTQRRAYADLQRTGHQWPLASPRYGGDRYTDTTRYSRATLHALVEAGLARWVICRPGAGVLPHIVPSGSR